MIIDYELCDNFSSWTCIFVFFIDKPKEAKKDTFLEKLATQVIKNVQVKITDIHIKYEDDVSSLLGVSNCVFYDINYWLIIIINY